MKSRLQKIGFMLLTLVLASGLTVSAVGGGQGGEPPWFEVSLIPATLSGTTLGSAQPGSGVNLEVDLIGKYVERLLAGQEPAVRP